jgi:hypothetical protein
VYFSYLNKSRKCGGPLFGAISYQRSKIMAIPCPGSDTYSQIFGAGRNGPNAFVAFIRAFLVLLFEIANSASLRRFLMQECKPGCDKFITGPSFTNFTVRTNPRAGGGFSCVIGGTLDARIDCVPMAVPASDEECMAKILAVAGEGESRPVPGTKPKKT